jgi:colanic acid/amylovoran biosynthesis protein
MIKKIVITNAWSFYNKGDAAIAIATVNKINEILPEAEKTLLAVDSNSFEKNKESFGNGIKILPMAHRFHPFNIIFTIFSVISSVNTLITSIVGIFYLLLQVALFPIFRRQNIVLDNILKEIESADLIVALGGNYLYSNKSFYNHLLILFYGIFIKKKKIILLSHSIGPFTDFVSTILAKLILNNVDAVIFREKLSYDYVSKNISKRHDYTISGDAAFLFHPLRNIEEVKEPKVIAISIRKWFFKSPHLFNNYLDTMIKIIHSLKEKKYRIYLIPFSYVGTSENDLELCNLVLKKIPENNENQVSILDIKDLSPSDIGNKMKEMNIDILIATRLHSAILAAIYNIPPIIISYQHFKAFGIGKQMGLEDYIIKMSDVNYDRITTMLNDLLENINAIKRELNDNVFKIWNETNNDYELLINRINANTK